MSLLGIIIDKAYSSERLENKGLGYVEGTSDERLLKELGVLALEKGTWKLKFKGEEVAELLNWIASGKPKGTLPSLAKKILCLKREKLVRGVKDAGTGTYSRSVENRYIAEIDAIFANVGDKVGCGQSTPGTKPVGKTDGAETGSMGPGSPSGRKSAKAENEPEEDNNSIITIESTNTESPAEPGPDPAPLPGSVLISAPGAGPTAGSAGASPIQPGPTKPPHEEPDVPVKTPTIAVRTVDKDVSTMFSRIILPSLADLLKRLQPGSLRNLLERVLALLTERSTEFGFAKLAEQVARIFQSDKSDNEVVRELGVTLGLTSSDAMPANPRTPSVRGTTEETVELRRYSCSDKVQCLQQLVYTTCGEASLLDPLLDHLHKLLAAFSSLPEKNSRVNSLQDSLSRLEAYIRAEAGNSAMNSNRSSLKTQLNTLESQLTALNSPPNSPMTGKTADMEASAQERAKRRTALQTEIAHVRELLETQDDPEARREMVRNQLFEEQDLLDALLRILPDSDPFLPIAEGFKSEILAQIRGIESAGLKILESACNKRSYAYRQELMNARENVDRLKEEELARQEQAFREERNALIGEKDAQIKDLQRRLTELEERHSTDFSSHTAEIKRLSGEKARLEAVLAAQSDREMGVKAGKLNAEQKVSTLEATIASLRAQLEQLTRSATSNDPLPFVSNNSRVVPGPVSPGSVSPGPVSPGSVLNRTRALKGATAPKFVSHRGPGFSARRRTNNSAHMTRKHRK